MNEERKGPQVRIHINRKPYGSPTPTTGEALYTLGSVPEHEKLYREVSGNHEDEPIVRDDEAVQLTAEEHFYSDRVTIIFVNGDEHEVEEKKIAYVQVVQLYLGSGGAASNEYLVKYSHGPAKNASGTLVPGQKVDIEDGMRFRIAGTGES